MTDSAPSSSGRDETQSLLAAVRQARKARKPLRIYGGDTKRDYIGRSIDAEPLAVAAHVGITNYEPGELVITARAGTTMAALQEATAEQGQTLAFEPPQFHGAATLGGTLACNLSGPARPWSGSIRDHVLGVQLINGKAELLDFGGRVMKNVAGYDVSRAQAGALGTLGIITEVSLKVMPIPEASATLRYEASMQDAITLMNQRAGEPKPLYGACWFDGQLFLRLAGTASAVEHTAQQWGGELTPESEAPWGALREFKLPFFSTDEPLWRLSVAATAAIPIPDSNTLIDWGGAQRWLRGDLNLEALQLSCAEAGGHANLFRGGNRQNDVRAIGNATERRLHQRLKDAFDPEHLFNPGRLYSWL